MKAYGRDFSGRAVVHLSKKKVPETPEHGGDSGQNTAPVASSSASYNSSSSSRSSRRAQFSNSSGSEPRAGGSESRKNALRTPTADGFVEIYWDEELCRLVTKKIDRGTDDLNAAFSSANGKGGASDDESSDSEDLSAWKPTRRSVSWSLHRAKNGDEDCDHDKEDDGSDSDNDNDNDNGNDSDDGGAVSDAAVASAPSPASSSPSFPPPPSGNDSSSDNKGSFFAASVRTASSTKKRKSYAGSSKINSRYSTRSMEDVGIARKSFALIPKTPTNTDAEHVVADTVTPKVKEATPAAAGEGKGRSRGSKSTNADPRRRSKRGSSSTGSKEEKKTLRQFFRGKKAAADSSPEDDDEASTSTSNSSPAPLISPASDASTPRAEMQGRACSVTSEDSDPSMSGDESNDGDDDYDEETFTSFKAKAPKKKKVGYGGLSKRSKIVQSVRTPSSSRKSSAFAQKRTAKSSKYFSNVAIKAIAAITPNVNIGQSPTKAVGKKTGSSSKAKAARRKSKVKALDELEKAKEYFRKLDESEVLKTN